MSCSHLRPLWHISCTVAYKSNCLHTGVRKSCIAHKLCQAFYYILERINSSSKVLLEGVHWIWSAEIMDKTIRNQSLSFLTADTNCMNILKEKKAGLHLLTICPVVWKASSTIVSSWSEAAWWNTENMFFQPDLMLEACEFTIWATHLITISLIVGDLRAYTDDVWLYV